MTAFAGEVTALSCETYIPVLDHPSLDLLLLPLDMHHVSWLTSTLDLNIFIYTCYHLCWLP